MVQDIAFIGDSFCADYELGRAELAFDLHKLNWAMQSLANDGCCWPTELANMLGYRVLPFGFGGMSWWHSRHMFMHHYWNDPKVDRSQLKVIIFCHTNADRIPKSDFKGLCEPALDEYNQKELEYYFSHLHDSQFAHWAQVQWFWEIRREFSNIKTVHLFSFEPNGFTAGWRDALSGICVIDPLIFLTIGELLGTKQDILHKISWGETRNNHLNDHNNFALAHALCELLENYSPGDYRLPLDKFDLPNTNYLNWPDGHYWTK